MEQHLDEILGEVWILRKALSMSTLLKGIRSFGLLNRIAWILWGCLGSAKPYWVSVSSSSFTLWLIDRLDFVLAERLCVSLFFGMVLPR